ncbi:GAF domain-containing protein [Ramlibacter sp.]|uniref:GGDEF domain-containing protein n=1 Tax=Ramlibacter sp. TaxID=1917967 RepID=UPI0017D2297A|nr:GAF domain-containing protein [Ramlibacter sp.]MBA2674932.1 GAF domain-containing protein [Ramlibacter sp.]
MLSIPFAEQQEQRIEVLGPDTVPPALPMAGDQRFERITRTAMRLLEIPIAFVTTWQEESHVLRSVQGLPMTLTGHALAFCDPHILDTQPLLVPDASINPLFWHNPLVTGSSQVRSFLGVPLQRMPGVRGGALCAMHVEARAFRQSDVLALQDLARLAETELQFDALGVVHRRVVARLGEMERRGHFDTVTGCWSVRSFRELVARAVADARAGGTSLALCYVRVKDFKQLVSGSKLRQDSLRQAVAYEVRRRLPDRGALGSLGGADFCALLPGADAAAVQAHLDTFTVPELRTEVGGTQMRLPLGFGCAALHDPAGHAGSSSGATEIWARALSNLEP